MIRKRRIVFFFSCLVFLACLFEGTARLAFVIPQIAQRLHANEDYTYIRNWVNERKKFDLNAYYRFDIYDSSRGWRTKPNINDLKVFDHKFLNTNSKGVRGKREFSYTKDKQNYAY